MLERIKGFFERHLLPPEAGADWEERQLRLAVAALLLEMTRMDESLRPEECAAVESAVEASFGLTREESRELLELAEAERRDATDYFQFTSLIKARYSPEQRAQLVEQLWRVAYADSVLNPHEEYLVRKVAGLLHVSGQDFVAARLRAESDR
jgi:uncharacterized tellurite resistance protein B-like protein